MARVTHTWTRVEKRMVVTCHWGFSYPIIPRISWQNRNLSPLNLDLTCKLIGLLKTWPVDSKHLGMYTGPVRLGGKEMCVHAIISGTINHHDRLGVGNSFTATNFCTFQKQRIVEYFTSWLHPCEHLGENDAKIL